MSKIENKYDLATTALSVEEQYQVRVNKVDRMKALGDQAWPQVMPVSHTAMQVLQSYSEENQQQYQVAGRIISMRWHGKTAFINLQDRSGQIQVYLRSDAVGEAKFGWLQEFLDIGDHLWVTGALFKTKTGEITLRVGDAALISKCLHPLPEKFHGLTDVEIRYRQRYLDLISNPESKDRFLKRSKIIALLRSYLTNLDFVEVETPMLHPIPGGALAKPFITHHNALDDDFYLRIAPELYLKRLVIGGIERVFEINRNFRNEGVSTRHNPEFTMLEFYMAHQEYKYGMDLVEDMLRSIAQAVCGQTKLVYGKHEIDFGKSFERVSLKTGILKYTKLTEQDLLPENIDQILAKNNLVLMNKQASLNEKLYLLFDELVEPNLIQPTFLVDFPIEVSPLAKRDPQDPSIASRYELFIGGMEIANAFSELNDPFDQAARFHEQAASRGSGDEEAHHYDADYIRALEYGLPPTLGVGIGIDRLVMLLTNTTSIRDVILFPTLKKK
jgi:lysyl-tRNA synthetase class 2